MDFMTFLFSLFIPAVSQFLTKLVLVASAPCSTIFDFLLSPDMTTLEGVGLLGETVTLAIPPFLADIPTAFTDLLDGIRTAFVGLGVIDMPFMLGLLTVLVELVFIIFVIRLIIKLLSAIL